MASFIPASKTAKVVLEGVFWDQEWVNTLWVQVAPIITQAILELIGQTISDWWATNMAPLHRTNSQLLRTIATDQTVVNGAQAEIFDIHNGTTGTGVALPSAIAPVITMRTAKTGRSFRGRNYLSGVGDTFTTSGDRNELTSAAAANYVAAYATLMTDLGAMFTPGTLVVASHRNGGADRANAVLTPVTGFTMDLPLDIQRRRGEGRGR